MNERTVEELAQHVGGRVVGDGSRKISSVAALAQAGAGQISFLANSRYTKQLADTKAAAVLLSEPATACPATQVIVADPYYAFTQIAVLMHGHRPHDFTGISSRAAIDPTATIGEETRIHHFVTISQNARVGRRCVIYPNVFIGPGAEIGDDCILYANVAIHDSVRVGHRVIIQAGTSVGGDGFGFATHKGVHHKIPHLGRVILEDDVALGANCSVQSGALYNTVVGRGTKTGDLVVIGHGVQTGQGCLIVTQAGIAGSTTLGQYCVLAGQVGVAGHLKIGNQVTVAAQSGVTNDLEDGAKVFGSPAFDMKEAVKAYTSIKSLPEMRKVLRELEKRVTQLEGGKPSA
jgi:UDP-3-O-[3-hydroxymyristoyl] glucosamine N-acyltransferase